MTARSKKISGPPDLTVWYYIALTDYYSIYIPTYAYKTLILQRTLVNQYLELVSWQKKPPNYLPEIE